MVPIAVRDYLRFGVLQSLSLFKAMTRYPTLERIPGNLAEVELEHGQRHVLVGDAAPADDLRRLLVDTRALGFAISARTFEDEVVGIAAPFFDASGQVYGTVAVASVASRFTSERERSIAAAVRKAANEVTTAIGGEVPDEIRVGEEAAA